MSNTNDSILALKAKYPETIAKMKSSFTSHQFIQKLTESFQYDYINALHFYNNKPDPFRIVHQKISAILGQKEFSKLIQRDGDEIHTKDIFGKPNFCAKWKKIA